MSPEHRSQARTVSAVWTKQPIVPDPEFVVGLSLYLKTVYTTDTLGEFYSRFAGGDSAFDGLMRRAIWRAFARRFGNGVRIDPGVGFKHLETFEIGDGVFIGAQAYIQG